MIALLSLLFFLACLLVVEAFFSSSEIAFTSANRPRILRHAKEGVPGALRAKVLLNRPEVVFSTCVVGTTIAINCATTITALYILRHFGIQGEWLNLLFLTPIILIFGEFIPKMIGRTHAEAVLYNVSRPLSIMGFVLYPVTRLLTWYAHVLRRALGDKPEKSFFLSREEIRGALPASRGSDVTPAERHLIERILDFGKINVKEMMRPLIDVVAIEESQTVGEALKLLNESEHSRLPVYQDRIDRMVGVLQGFDCLREDDLEQPVNKLMQPALFVPLSQPIDELFTELRSRPMAIAVNEFGGAEGIITMEDVMEEVVGEIEDEYDEPTPLYHSIGENSYIVNARIEIDELRNVLNIPIPEDEDYQTLAGFLLKRMQRIPKKWDSTVIDNVEYVVQSATDRSIEEVYVIVHARMRA